LQIYTDGQVWFYNNGNSNITSITGTTEDVVCNNRGVCNSFTGECECFAGWASSDGNGSPGLLGDCGYIVDVQKNN
jgi:hypothetical protein